MANQVLLYRMPNAMQGDTNRGETLSIITEVLTPLGSDGHPTSYGIPVVIDSTTHQVRMVLTSDAGDNLSLIAGILVRPYVASDDMSGLNGSSVPPPEGPCDVLRRGFIGVTLSGDAAATRNAPVYVWIGAPSGTHITGGFEAAGSGGTIPINARFRGPADAGGTVEISYHVGALSADILHDVFARAALAGAGGAGVSGTTGFEAASTTIAGTGAVSAATIERAIAQAAAAGLGSVTVGGVQYQIGKATLAGTGGVVATAA